MDGNLAAAGDPPVGWVDFWTAVLQTNDMLNPSTGKFDPRHAYGTTNQDVFRWPTIKNGTQKQVLGFFIVTLLLPGVPTVVYGEEQAFYILDNTASNYVFGRAPMTSASAWNMHGCYKVGNIHYYDFPIDAGSDGCKDDHVMLDHRDPSHPIHNLYKTSFEIRANYPVFQDGFSLGLLSKQTHFIQMPGSNGTETEIGMWSIERSGLDAVQDLNQKAWLVFSNENQSMTYVFNCSDFNTALIAPFPPRTTVKNVYFPFEEYTTTASVIPDGKS